MNDDEYERRDIMWAVRPNKATFGMSPIQAFEFCKQVFDGMERSEEAKLAKAATGRRAAVAATKRRHEEDSS